MTLYKYHTIVMRGHLIEGTGTKVQTRNDQRDTNLVGLGSVDTCLETKRAVAAAAPSTIEEHAVGRDAILQIVVGNRDALGGVEIVQTVRAVGKRLRLGDLVSDRVNEASNIRNGKTNKKESDDPLELRVDVLSAVPPPHKDDSNSHSSESKDKNEVREILIHKRDNDTSKNGSKSHQAESNRADVEHGLLPFSSLTIKRTFHLQ